ncbi:hypothetical protein D9M71_672270 [compost metagenome]
MLRQLLLTDFQGQSLTEIRMLTQDFKHFIQCLRIGQGSRRQVQRQRLFMVGHLLKYQLQHQPIKPSGPAKALEPRQEAPGRNALALIVDQP